MRLAQSVAKTVLDGFLDIVAGPRVTAGLLLHRQPGSDQLSADGLVIEAQPGREAAHLEAFVIERLALGSRNRGADAVARLGDRRFGIEVDKFAVRRTAVRRQRRVLLVGDLDLDRDRNSPPAAASTAGSSANCTGRPSDTVRMASRPARGLGSGSLKSMPLAKPGAYLAALIKSAVTPVWRCLVVEMQSAGGRMHARHQRQLGCPEQFRGTIC